MLISPFTRYQSIPDQSVAAGNDKHLVVWISACKREDAGFIKDIIAKPGSEERD